MQTAGKMTDQQPHLDASVAGGCEHLLIAGVTAKVVGMCADGRQTVPYDRI